MSKIEWCDETINPLGWGCYGPEGTAAKPKPCSYCYARRASRGPWAAQRGCPKCAAFIPHWHPEMLEKPLRWKKPRRIFVQSMGDLFHPETPREHIEAVLETVRDCPQHTFIFLTKNPKRYQEFVFPKNCLLGATATDQESWDRAADAFYGYPPGRWRISHHDRIFISAEPLLGPINDPGCFMTDLSWLIIGANSNRGAEKPNNDWCDALVNDAENAGVPVFVKNNWPWQRQPYDHFPQGWPQENPREEEDV